MAAPILRPEATLVGRSVVNLFSADPGRQRGYAGLLDADVSFQLEPQQILGRIGALTGEPPEAPVRMAGRNQSSWQSVTRFAILAAKGFPDGQEVSATKGGQVRCTGPCAGHVRQPGRGVQHPGQATTSSGRLVRNLPGPLPGKPRRKRGGLLRARTWTAPTGVI